MTDETRNGSASPGEPVNEPIGEPNESPAPEPSQQPARPQQQLPDFLPLPGLAAIALYMLLLAGVCILGVVNGALRPAYLLFSAFFITAALGLLRLMRWAWAMALGAVVLLVALFTWKFTTGHQIPYLVQGLLNLVFFLYLIRTEVRSKLR
jgi:hypothetical protein